MPHFHANRALKWSILCNIPGLLLIARFSRNLANFEPRLDIKRGHFSRVMGWPKPPPKILENYWGIWHFWRSLILGATRELKWPISAKFQASPREPDFSQNLANFEPRLDIKRGHFSRLMGRPWFFLNFGKSWEIDISDDGEFWTLTAN